MDFSAQQAGFLKELPSSKPLTRDVEGIFVELVGDRVLVLKDFPLSDVVVLTPSPINSELYALSHRWDSSKMVSKVLCVVDPVGDGQTYFYWTALAEDGLKDSLLQIPDARGHLWMDQICIPQDADAFKGAQIQFMGKLYTHATSVVSGSNGVSDRLDVQTYFERAWTQQEFSFGKVMLHPGILLSTKDKIQFIVESFRNCKALQAVVDAAAHHSYGLYWIRSYEEGRITAFDEQIADTNDELKQQVHDLWEQGWETYDSEEILRMLEKFRATCKWSGAEILGPGPQSGNCAFNRMFFVQCQFPKDQLFGMMGAAVYSGTGNNLDYTDVEGSYLKVLEFLKLPLLIGPRSDGDGTGVDGYLTPLIWRTNKWGAQVEGDVFREAQHIWHFPRTFPQRSQFGHHWAINADIEVWKFERDGKSWLALGITRDGEEKRGKVALCIQTEDLYEHRSLVVTMIASYLEDKGYFDRSSACNWRFYVDLQLLFDELHSPEAVEEYVADGSVWNIA
eukprot:c5760_g1_i1.p1 GENE.c5760_g1_i1~~c5760_g1_i1.p1  ORF type:complete len:523 (-),score=123.00 c5760_g1_i1:38-1558(-)